jgi:hypothetical protein
MGLYFATKPNGFVAKFLDTVEKLPFRAAGARVQPLPHKQHVSDFNGLRERGRLKS